MRTISQDFLSRLKTRKPSTVKHADLSLKNIYSSNRHYISTYWLRYFNKFNNSELEKKLNKHIITKSKSCSIADVTINLIF